MPKTDSSTIPLFDLGSITACRFFASKKAQNVNVSLAIRRSLPYNTVGNGLGSTSA
jgi:hypothetical protein